MQIWSYNLKLAATTVVALVVGYVAARLFPSLASISIRPASGFTAEEWGVANALATIGSAVGTFVAAGIALWIAMRDGRERRSEALTRAKLAAAYATPKLNRADRQLLRLEVLVERIRRDETVDIEQIRRTSDLAASIHESLKLPHLRELTALPNDCAHKLAQAASLAGVVKSTLTEHRGLFAKPASRRIGATKPIVAAECLRAIREVRDLAYDAAKECERASGHVALTVRRRNLGKQIVEARQ